MTEPTNRCIICGKNVPSANQLYCGPTCRNKGWYRREVCLDTDYLDCYGGDCSRCGWNPEVEKRRKEALEAKYGEWTG